ncbi:MAG: peroxiredoxin [Deltaproteobacteria bacterium HGW-Deltaproteobacteria-6]|jgi:putative redox protein|nr:MAG: peroxiredoxin [Deltaproteobacteria bacterium HGW-Deltaproteobacteria-6]
MADVNKDNLNESLSGYKQSINPIVKTTLTWDRDLVFTGTTQQGYEIEFDGQAQWGCKPTESLLLSLAGCMGIDVVTILTKMRIALTGFRMEIAGERNPAPPQYYRVVEMVLHIAGENLDPGKVERAIALSKDKYCSVYNSLRPDMVFNVRYVLEEKNTQRAL